MSEIGKTTDSKFPVFRAGENLAKVVDHQHQNRINRSLERLSQRVFGNNNAQLTTGPVNFNKRRVEPLPNGVIRVRNDFAFRLRKWDTVGVDDALIDTENSFVEAENINQSVFFSCTKPQPRHVSRWAVLHQALMPGEIGLATVEGVSPVRVDLTQSYFTGRDAILDSIYGLNPSDTSTGEELHGVALYASQFSEWYSEYGISNDNSSFIPDAVWYYLSLRDSNGAYMSNAERIPYRSTERDWIRYSTTPSMETKVADDPPDTYDGPAEGSVLSFHKGYKAGRQFQGRFASGGTTFKCVNSRWEVASTTCESGSNSWFYVEHENAIYTLTKAGLWPDLRGTPGWNGLEYPCVEDEEISGVPCLYDYEDAALATAVLAHPEIRVRTDDCSHVTTCVYECLNNGTSWEWYTTRTCRQPCRCTSIDTDLYPCDGIAEPTRVQLPCRPTSTTTTEPPTTTSHPPTCADSLPSGVAQPFIPEGYMCDYECRCVGEDDWTWVLISNNCSSFSELCSCDAEMDNVGGVPWSPQYCYPAIAGTIYSKECVAAADTTTTAAPLEECDCTGSCVWECSYVEPGSNVANQGPNREAWQLASFSCNPASRVCNCGSVTPSGPCVAPTNIGDIETFDCGRTTTSQPPGTGACCSLAGVCLVKAEEFCESPSIWLGAGTTCTPNNPCLTTTSLPPTTTTTTTAVPCSGTCRCTCNGSTYVLSANNCSSALNCNCECPNISCASGETFVACFVTTTTTTTTTTTSTSTTTTTTTSAPPTTTTTTTTTTTSTSTTTTTTTTTSAPPNTTTTTTTSGAPCTGQCQYVCTNPGGEAYQWQLYNSTCVGTCVTCYEAFADPNCNSGTIDTTTDVSCMPA